MRNFYCIILILIFSTAYSQNKTVNAEIITFENDTLNANVKVVTNMFDSSLIYGSTFNKKFTILKDSGEKIKMETIHVKELSFVDFSGKQRKFVNRAEDKKSLFEIIHDGENLEWIRSYTPTNGGENASDFLFNKKKNEGIVVGYFTGIPKKKLQEFLGDEPEMENFIEEAKSSSLRNADNYIYNVMETIVMKYESLKSKK